MENKIINEYSKTWELIKLDKTRSFEDNAILEIKDYFGYADENIKEIMASSEKLLAAEWNKHFLNKKLEESSIVNFYDKTKLEIFELMNWHYFSFKNGPLQYVFALDVGQRNDYINYLDYGSGIGSGGILFALRNFKVTLADISSANLEFCKYRFRKRSLEVNLIDLKKNKPKKREYDIITCFDVLEHAWNPIEILKILRDALKDSGILIINTPFKKDRKKPMHIATNKKIANNIRSTGFSHDWNLVIECERNIKRQVFVLKKQNRNFVLNKMFFIYDNMPIFAKRMLSCYYRKIINKNGKK